MDYRISLEVRSWFWLTTDSSPELDAELELEVWGVVGFDFYKVGLEFWPDLPCPKWL